MFHILEQEVAARESHSPSRLSPDELVYAKEYADNMDSHWKTLVLRHLPPNFKGVDRKKAGLLSFVIGLGKGRLTFQ